MSLPINDLSYVLQSTKEYIHRNLEPNFQYGVAVLVLLGSQGSKIKFLQFYPTFMGDKIDFLYIVESALKS